jgi:hypothetical protein
MKFDQMSWLIGLLEGEGAFILTKAHYTGTKRVSGREYLYPAIKLNMTDEDTVRKAAELMGGCAVCRVRHHPYQDTFMVTLSGARALRMMEQIRPFLSTRRAAKIGEIVIAIGEKYRAKLDRLER